MVLDRLRRMTDLFVEGAELYLGDDDQKKPVVVWINKLNSFEIEEARKDGLASRSLRLIELSKDDCPERMAAAYELRNLSNEDLVNARIAQMGEELYLAAMDDLESDPEWKEKLDTLRRLPELLFDSRAADDDPRRADLDALNKAYVEKLQATIQSKTDDKRKEMSKRLDRDGLVDAWLSDWQERQSLDDFMAERRMTEIFYALRDCVATGTVVDGAAVGGFDHSKCDHGRRLLNARSQVRDLPEQAIERIVRAVDGLTMSSREAGNLDAPASSSESLGQSNAAEAPSTASIPKEM